MPVAAISTGCVDLVLDPEAIAAALCQFIRDDERRDLTREWEAPFALAGL